jgi:hypothetical protein
MINYWFEIFFDFLILIVKIQLEVNHWLKVKEIMKQRKTKKLQWNRYDYLWNINSIYFFSFKTRNFIPFEKALTDEWKPNRRQSTIRSAVTTYNLLRGKCWLIHDFVIITFVLKALLSFYEQYQRIPALATQETDIPNLMKIIRDKTSLSTASASSLNSDEFNEELLK